MYELSANILYTAIYLYLLINIYIKDNPNAKRYRQGIGRAYAKRALKLISEAAANARALAIATE